MLDDPKAIAIISGARQKNVAAAKRSSADFDHIFEDFFAGVDLSDRRVLDLGPGQYDFARRIRERGAVALNVDNDPAVIELGRYLGFDVADENLKQLDTESRRGSLDGVFCKFAINAFWFDEPEENVPFIERLDAMLRPGGFGWIGPWNGPGRRGDSPERIRSYLETQEAAFLSCGWTAYPLTDRLARRYGIHGAVANNVIFTKALPEPRRLKGAGRTV